jgi:UDP-N-acetyl-D-galactosamine dehydrogenase
VTVLGVTFKEDVPDVRNSKTVDIIAELQSFGVRVAVADPHADKGLLEHEYGIRLTAPGDLEPSDAIIASVAHREFRDAGWNGVTGLLKGNSGVVLDVKGFLDRAQTPAGVTLWRL